MAIKDWLDGVTIMTVPGIAGGTVDSSYADRVTLHSTEGPSIAGAYNAYVNRGVPPHFTGAFEYGQLAQHLPLSRSAYAVKNLKGGVETNRAGHNIQIEIVGYAESMLMSAKAYQRLANLLTAIKAAGINVDLSYILQFHNYPPENGHRLGSEPWRMGNSLWHTFNGVCGHQHLPENVHGDPGPIDRVKLLNALSPEAKKKEEKKMLFNYVAYKGQAEIYAANVATEAVHVTNFITFEDIVSRQGHGIAVPPNGVPSRSDPAGSTRLIWELDANDPNAVMFKLPPSK